jgi:type VI secretion system protein VasJ
LANLQDIAPLGTTPIPGRPTGATTRYEPEYEAIQLEIEKLQSVSQTPVRWDTVVSNATVLLSKKTKDLLIASYMSAGLFSENGYAGLSAGLTFYKDFLGTFWDKFFPPVEKMRGREGAVKWFDERAAKMVAEAPAPSESDRESIQACLTAVEALNSLLGEKFTDSPIGFSDLSEKLQEKQYAVPEPAAAAAPSSGDSGSRSGADRRWAMAVLCLAVPLRPAVAAASAEVDSRPRERIGPEGRRLPQESERTDPRSQPGAPSNVGALADVPDPMPGGADAAVLPTWESGLKKKEFQRVLDETEGKFSGAPLWLDLNLYAVRAMEGLGPTYDAARAAIGAQLGALVRRLPELPAATLEGGVAAASEVTRQWIDDELLGGRAKPAAGEGADRIEESMQEARKLATKPAATALVQKELLTVPPGGRDSCGADLAKLARNQPAGPGRPQLEALDAEAERGLLEQWNRNLP